MASSSDKHGLCPIPFMQQSLFPSEGGFVGGRMCEDLPLGGQTVSCCLPCPFANWRYSDGLAEKAKAANWVAVAMLVLNALILISFAALPVKWTHRHYLGICLIIAIMIMELAFIVPLGSQPEECYNEITPHGMRSDLSCAFSGAFVVFGGWAVVMWSFCRTLALHLQICWDIVIGKKFLIGTMAFGWGIPAIGLILALTITGVSYRFGNVCHINHEKSIQDFWGPLMAFAAAALIIQFVTLTYCIHVYVRSLLDKNPSTDHSSALPSYSGSVRTVTARQAYRRIKRIVQLQWRGIAVVLAVLGNVIFFTVIFLSLDSSVDNTPEQRKKNEPWLMCLFLAKGNKNDCMELAADLGPNEASVLAVFIMLSLVGIWTVICLGRFSMILGWIDLIKRWVSPKREFVSADARADGTHSRAYEMLSGRQDVVKSPDPLLSYSHSDMSMSPLGFSGAKAMEADNYHREAKYTSPALSFSAPRPPSATRYHNRQGSDWNPQATFARSGSTRAYWDSDGKRYR